MFSYHLGIAVRSLRRTPVLSSLLVAGIAVGIAVSTAFVAAYHVQSRDPIPAKSRSLYYVSLDSWSKDRPFDRDLPTEPPDQLTYRDAIALMECRLPRHQAAMFKAGLMVHPEGKDARPYRARTQMTFTGFFAMFEPPFEYGGPWTPEADDGPQAVAVLDHRTNQKLFGGANSVGRELRVEGRPFTIVGVLAPWSPKPKFFDPHNNAFEEPQEIYLPLRWAAPLEVSSTGNRNGWKRADSDSYQGLLDSESVWIQFWAELPDAQAREAYAAWLTAYVGEQKRLGRFERPLNNRLRDVREWLAYMQVVPSSARTMLIVSLLFLVVSSVNLIGILLGKFLARSSEVGVRRALGASRTQVFLQHLIECELVALLGGLVGIVLAIPLLHALDRMSRSGADTALLTLEWPVVLAGFGLALLAGLVAGAYPAWRICRIPPALHLKQA